MTESEPRLFDQVIHLPYATERKYPNDEFENVTESAVVVNFYYIIDITQNKRELRDYEKY